MMVSAGHNPILSQGRSVLLGVAQLSLFTGPEGLPLILTLVRIYSHARKGSEAVENPKNRTQWLRYHLRPMCQ